ncbi:hypothetical protein ISN45_At03g022430, partial [Arabidopsis thaliana x Arabidopsis arenosa]
ARFFPSIIFDSSRAYCYLELRYFDHKKRINISHPLLCLFH